MANVDALRTAFYQVPPLPQPTGLVYGGAGNVVDFRIDIPVESRVVAALSSPGKLTLHGAIDDAQTTSLLNDFNARTAGIARGLKTFGFASDARGTTTLIFRDAYPGNSGMMLFQDIFDETAFALRNDYSEIQTHIGARCS